MKTEENILNTTYELLLEKRNLNISMSELCKRSKTSPGTIYYHFENKEELIKTTITKYIIDVYFNQISYIQNLDGTTFDKIKCCYYFAINTNHDTTKHYDLQKILLLILQSNEKYPELFQKYSKIRSTFNEVLNNIICEGIKNGELKADLNVEKLIYILKKDINGIFFTRYLNDIEDIQKLTDYTFELTWNCIKK